VGNISSGSFGGFSLSEDSWTCAIGVSAGHCFVDTLDDEPIRTENSYVLRNPNGEADCAFFRVGDGTNSFFNQLY